MVVRNFVRFIQQRCIHVIKRDSKHTYNVIVQINDKFCCFELSVYQRFLKNIMVSTKILSSLTVFNI